MTLHLKKKEPINQNASIVLKYEKYIYNIYFERSGLSVIGLTCPLTQNRIEQFTHAPNPFWMVVIPWCIVY